MLSATRKFAKSWVAAVLIGLLVISFAIFGINDAFNGNYTDDVIKAGSRTVSGPDFRREFDNFRKGAEEQAKHMKHASAGSKDATPAALPGGREQRTPPPEPTAAAAP